MPKVMDEGTFKKHLRKEISKISNVEFITSYQTNKSMDSEMYINLFNTMKDLSIRSDLQLPKLLTYCKRQVNKLIRYNLRHKYVYLKKKAKYESDKSKSN